MIYTRPTRLESMALSMLILLTLSAPAQNLMPIRWTADASKEVAAQLTIAQGETRDLVCTLKNYGAAISVPSNATASLSYQTNGMATAWWSGPSASVTTGGVITATWTPSLDVGASAYTFALGVLSGTNRIYTAYGIIRMRHSPGYVPNELALPVNVLDFDTITLTNEPWATPADVAAASAQTLGLSSNIFIRVEQISAGVWKPVLPGE